MSALSPPGNAVCELEWNRTRCLDNHTRGVHQIGKNVLSANHRPACCWKRWMEEKSPGSNSAPFLYKPVRIKYQLKISLEPFKAQQKHNDLLTPGWSSAYSFRFFVTFESSTSFQREFKIKISEKCHYALRCWAPVSWQMWRYSIRTRFASGEVYIQPQPWNGPPCTTAAPSHSCPDVSLKTTMKTADWTWKAACIKLILSLYVTACRDKRSLF